VPGELSCFLIFLGGIPLDQEGGGTEAADLKSFSSYLKGPDRFTGWARKDTWLQEEKNVRGGFILTGKRG